MLHLPIIHFLSGKGLILEISPVWNAGGLFIKTGLALAKLNKNIKRDASAGVARDP